MELQIVRWEVMSYIGPVQDSGGWQAVVNAVVYFHVP